VTAWVLSDAVYTGNSLTLANGDARGLYIKPDGTELYVTDLTDDTVYQYTLSSPFELSSATYSGNSFLVSQDGGEKAIWFKPDGLKMYIVGNSTDDAFQYTLSTAWDISTASYDSVSFALSAGIITPLGLYFKPDGTSFFVADLRNDEVLQFDLSTAWDLSTASISPNTFSIASQSANATGLSFKDDGAKMYVTDFSTAAVYQYTLSTAWDITSASYDTVSLSTSAQSSSPYALFFADSGGRLYHMGGADVFEYTLVATQGRAVDTQAAANSVSNVLSLNSAAVDPSANSVVVTPAPNALT
jgi:sugar lactone lactonase YvrE